MKNVGWVFSWKCCSSALILLLIFHLKVKFSVARCFFLLENEEQWCRTFCWMTGYNTNKPHAQSIYITFASVCPGKWNIFGVTVCASLLVSPFSAHVFLLLLHHVFLCSSQKSLFCPAFIYATRQHIYVPAFPVFCTLLCIFIQSKLQRKLWHCVKHE